MLHVCIMTINSDCIFGHVSVDEKKLRWSFMWDIFKANDFHLNIEFVYICYTGGYGQISKFK